MSTYHKVYIWILLLISSLHPQSIEPQFDRLVVEEPVCVHQDNRGFIWIGAQVGLFRYDGYELKQYNPEPFDSTSLSTNCVMVIKEDNKGNLWIGTLGGGLNYFDQRTETFTRYLDDPSNPDDIGSNMIVHIVLNDDGSLWLGTTDNGLTRLTWNENGNPEFRHYNHHTNPGFRVSDDGISALYLDRQNILWVGTLFDGLIRFDPVTQASRMFQHDAGDPTSISHNTVSSICEDDSGDLWIGSGHVMVQKGKGLNRFNLRSETFTHFKNDPADPSSLCSNLVSCLLIDSQDVLWIGTRDYGITSIPLSELKNDLKPKFKRYLNFWDLIINSIYEDQLGNIWIAAMSDFVHKLDRRQNPFVYYGPIRDKPGSMQDSGIECLYIDKKGNIWFGHHFSGLDKYDPVSDMYTHYPHIPGSNRGPSSNWINGICEDAEGNLWIGTNENGLDCLNPVTGVFKNIRSDPADRYGLKSDYIRCMTMDRKGNLWLGLQNAGVQLYDIGTGRFISQEFGLESTKTGEIHTLYEDHQGILWIGTISNGVYALSVHKQQITATRHYFHDPHDSSSMSNYCVNDIIRPQVYDTNAVWIATDNGLNRLDLTTGRFIHYYEKDDLPDSYVLAVLEDHSGNIWMATPKGIGKYNFTTKEFRNYDKGDGLPFTGFGGARQNTAKAADGQLFFSGGSGSIGIYPDRIKDNQILPPVRLTDFRIFHESFKLDTAIQFLKTITLTHDQNAFSFKFTALNFTNPGKNQYAYKMEGFHDDWIHIGNERMASFTNLDPGAYVFRVKGSNNHGYWNEEGTSIRVVILPPWWRTGWAYSVYLLIGFGILYGVRRYDLKRQRLKHQLTLEHQHAENLREIDRMKSRFFANISHEFRTPLTLILGPIKKWLPQLRNPELKTDLDMMQRNANRLYRLINQLLDLSRLESGSMTLQVREENIVPLLRGYVQSFESLARIKKIDLDFKCECEDIKVYMDRDKIEKIMYNLLSNAFKFTPEGGKVEVEISCNDGRGRSRSTPTPELSSSGTITVTNTGPVIPPDKIGRIFDRFYQVEDSEIRGHEGSGIGLALTRELVELHHGEITVESTAEKGTIFTVRLPLGKEHLNPIEFSLEIKEPVEPVISDLEIETAWEHKRKPRSIKKAPHVLVVEDNRDVRYYIRGHLEKQYRISEAANGREGLQAAIARIPDLIISDVMMPEMDGFELCRRLKADERTSHIPVILLTARAASEDKIGGLETGADDYLTKPFDALELKVRIMNLIKQREKLRDHYMQTLKLDTDKAVMASADQSFINKLNALIGKNLDNAEYSVEQLAREIGFSHSQLVRKLESITGLTPSSFIRAQRLLRARGLLDQKTGTVSQIAFECGFSNLSYFSHCFKIQFGQLPSEYIRNIQ